MAHMTFLRTSANEVRTAKELVAAPVLLRSKDYMPLLLPALFTPDDFAAAPTTTWVETRHRDAVERLRQVYAGAASDPRFAALWEACPLVIDWLVELDGGGHLVLDARELAGMFPRRELAAQLARAAATYRSLAKAWSPTTAQGLLPEVLQTSESPAADEIALRRWTKHPNPRAARFLFAFGWPSDAEALARRWQPWFDASPPGAPMPRPADEAERLRSWLAERGLVVFSNEVSQQGWIPRFLAISLRERTAASLETVLHVMQARGGVLDIRATPAELDAALRALDQPA